MQDPDAEALHGIFWCRVLVMRIITLDIAGEARGNQKVLSRWWTRASEGVKARPFTLIYRSAVPSAYEF